MRILPVIDLKGGQVVRGAGGRRREYRPVTSRLTASPDPVAVASAFRKHFGLADLYVADLDAIENGQPAWPTYEAIRTQGFGLWVDAGVRDVQDALRLAGAGIEQTVLGLETLGGPDTLDEILRRLPPERVVFSLDLKDGRPLGGPAWGIDLRAIISRAALAGIRRAIILDLARVGGRAGTGTDVLTSALAAAHPDVEFIAGGGIRDLADLLRLRRLGIRGALVASAFHDGRIVPADLESLGRVGP